MAKINGLISSELEIIKPDGSISSIECKSVTIDYGKQDTTFEKAWERLTIVRPAATLLLGSLARRLISLLFSPRWGTAMILFANGFAPSPYNCSCKTSASASKSLPRKINGI